MSIQSGMKFATGVLVAALLAIAVQGFYIPGINPVSYNEGDVVNILVNGLHSLRALVPYDYYYGPFCMPVNLKSRHETIGEMLSGDRIRTSPYFVNMNYDARCVPLTCSASDTIATKEKLQRLEDLIEKRYRGYMVIDNLPVFNNGTQMYQGRCVKLPFRQDSYDFLRGYAVGVPKSCHGTNTLINNHLHFRIQFHRVSPTDVTSVTSYGETGGYVAGETKKGKKDKKAKLDEEDQFLVVGFTAEPFSINFGEPTADGKVPGCDEDFDPYSAKWKPLTTDPAQTKRLVWTYGVTWVEEPSIRWASRWDSYLHTSPADTNDKTHWLAIMNILLIVMCLTSAIFVVLVRVLRRDLARYNAFFELTKEEQEEGKKEDGGWKAVHGDVFRAPKNLHTFVVFVSSGVQLVAMTTVTLIFAALGFLSPANRGGLMTALLSLFVLQAFVAGYFASRMVRKLEGEKSWALIFKVGCFVPSIMFGVFLTSNYVLYSVKSSGAVPFVTLLTLLALWLGVSLPLCVIGASFGYGVTPSPHPRPVSPNPRPIDISMTPWFMQTVPAVLLVGLIPFGALFLELKYILASLWQGMVYYVFGFLGLVFLLWVLTASLSSIVIVYYRLCAENYHWWWLSYLAPSSAGVWMYAYFIFYFATQLSITSTAATFIFFSYMALVAFFYVLASGAIGFLATWLFVNKIYSSVKID